VCGLALAAAANASATDGLAREDDARLLEACRHAQNEIAAEPAVGQAHIDASLCIGFVEGFVWGHGWKSWRAGDDMYFCLPEGFGYRDAVPSVVSYLEAHPERLIQRAHLLVFSALSSAYPCAQ
jgi:hypothetical protein